MSECRSFIRSQAKQRKVENLVVVRFLSKNLKQYYLKSIGATEQKLSSETAENVQISKSYELC